MKAIIYTSFQEAEAALKHCNEQVQDGEPQQIGLIHEGQNDLVSRPYTYIVSHTEKPLFAIVADQKVEQCIGRMGVDLTPDWFPAPIEKRPKKTNL